MLVQYVSAIEVYWWSVSICEICSQLCANIRRFTYVKSAVRQHSEGSQCTRQAVGHLLLMLFMLH